jgi:hypothetical protein
MGNNDLTNNENILIKVDQNNLIYIDPNSVLVGNEVEPRGIKQENLMMYLNLEADIIPRTILLAENDKNTLISIAKGTFNMLSNSNSSGNENFFDTSWTEAFLNKTDIIKNEVVVSSNQSDSSAQSFGIESVQITTKGFNAIPIVKINFIDVRGKTLFESPENSPYKAFFHLPWPIFYLTVKGYYGKAIRYRLHLIKFTSRFNENNGNFEISCDFVGSTFAYLNDIPLNGILNSPYMFMVDKESTTNTNTKTGNKTQVISKSSRGYQILNSVYNEYKQKGLIDKNFPVKTLREVIVVAETLDKILEREIFDQLVDMRIFGAIKEFETTIRNFQSEVVAWGNANLELKIEGFTGNTGDSSYPNSFYYYNKGLKDDKTSTENLLGDKLGTLEYIIKIYKKQLNDSKLYVNYKLNKNLRSNFTTLKSDSYIRDVGTYYKVDTSKQIGVAIDYLINDIKRITSDFIKQRDTLEKEVEEIINTVLKDVNKGIGFEPTVRNIFAVILANADTYIRLLKDVHRKAVDSGQLRKDKLRGLTEEATNNNPIYPWPEIKKNVGPKHKVLAYPADKDLIDKLKSDDPNLWPEVDFVEEYIAVGTKKYDNLSSKEGSVDKVDFIFESDSDEGRVKMISEFDNLRFGLPYIDKSLSGFLYEIYERSLYATLFDNLSLNGTTINELANIEFENIKQRIGNDNDLILLLTDHITNLTEFLIKMRLSSQFQRYPNVRDGLPTVPYISDIVDKPFKFKQYVSSTNNKNTSDSYPNLKSNISEYQVEEYRLKSYPFNSPLYLSYLKTNRVNKDDYDYSKSLNVDTVNGLISSNINPKEWINGDTTNIFTQDFTIDNYKDNILNTPFFHKQLYVDFTKPDVKGKYVGSAYLLLNSLPFKNLDDTIFGTRMSALFKEIGATHFVPYHLLLKWGSIYHRYKRRINDNVDILDGFLNNQNQTTYFDGKNFFDGNLPFTTFTPIGITVTHSDQSDIGIHPYYDAIFHQIINGYNHYDPTLGNTSFNENVNLGKIKVRQRTNLTNKRNWTSFVDNSKYDSGDLRYTLLPCDGDNVININGTTNEFYLREQLNERIIWKDNNTYNSEYVLEGLTYPSYSQYNRTFGKTDNVFGIDTDYKKIIDLIGTFSPKILDEMESMFIEFASKSLNEENPSVRFISCNYTSFQNLLREMSTVTKKSGDDSLFLDDLIRDIKNNRQPDKLKSITNEILETKNLISFTLANPKEIDPYVIYGFTKLNKNSTLTFRGYNISQNTSNRKYIELYIGEDVDDNYLRFFTTNDIELSQENVLIFRPLILTFAGYYKENPLSSKTDFINYLTSIYKIDSDTLMTDNHTQFLNLIIGKLNTLERKTFTTSVTKRRGYNTDTLQLELYNTFKSFNDKWVAGNSIGQRLLMEEFLFLDKANKDIGSQAFFNIQRLIGFNDKRNQGLTLYNAISMLIADTGFDMRALPAYVNFYGSNYSDKTKVMPSRTISKNVFGTFLEVDYQESSPKIIIQYTGPTSKYLSLNEISNDFKFNDDSFYLGDVNKNPLIIVNSDIIKTGDLYKSNKVVGFEVNVGDQNESIFKSVSLDQSSIKNTSQSFYVMENLARSESGSNAYQVDIGLFDIYRQASYTCSVTCMGNVMIQPTMYFYLKNVPLFKGSYWIKDVTHNIKGNNIVTVFTGVRIPNVSLPDPKDSFMASYKPLFDTLTNIAVSKINSNKTTTTPITEKSITVGGKNVKIDKGPNKPITNEVTIKKSGYLNGVPFNGYDNDGNSEPELYIQYVVYNGTEWLRTTVVGMGGKNYPIDSTVNMNIISTVTDITRNPTEFNWSSIRNLSSTNEFYCTRFNLKRVTSDSLISTTTLFLNPKSNKTLQLTPNYNLDMVADKIKVQGPVSNGPRMETKYGMGMSLKLMKSLGLHDGDVVYFKFS